MPTKKITKLNLKIRHITKTRPLLELEHEGEFHATSKPTGGRISRRIVASEVLVDDKSTLFVDLKIVDPGISKKR